MSSGQNVKADTDWVHCINCDFHNIAEVIHDYETHTTSWDCPICDQPHTTNLNGDN